VFLCIFWGRGRSFQAPSVRAPAFNQVFLIGRQVALETHFSERQAIIPDVQRRMQALFGRLWSNSSLPTAVARAVVPLDQFSSLERKRVHALGGLNFKLSHSFGAESRGDEDNMKMPL
jgi:hypothetical protein